MTNRVRTQNALGYFLKSNKIEKAFYEKKEVWEYAITAIHHLVNNGLAEMELEVNFHPSSATLTPSGRALRNKEYNVNL